ncbi:tRNA-splicing endonuclease subunit Sen54 [Trichoplax sp. H2]|nr:tRNA-splicing endonuclease subunit Sen54 [Trichoplax sp. H2]|eukprot:RDD41584.1 tRNA-splicing endonuclease subunit Sen54 [Trichoplax sp. H2]
MHPHFKTPDELLKLGAKRRLDSNRLPVRGKKRMEATGSQREKKLIEKKQDQIEDILTEERLAKLSHLSRGEWNDQTLVAEIHYKKGSHWNYFGFPKGEIEILQPEEAVYLIEIGALELYYKGLPLSLQEAYSIILSKTFPIYKYQVYCHLLRLGFIVKRHLPARFKVNKETKSKLQPDHDVTEDYPIPLVTPMDAETTDKILNKLQVVKSTKMEEVTTKSGSKMEDTIDFDVYLPNANFKKVNFGLPNIAVKVSRYDDPFPDSSCIAKLINLCEAVPLKWALNENGDITFYSFDDMEIPVVS